MRPLGRRWFARFGIGASCALALAACGMDTNQPPVPQAVALVGGNPENGRTLLRRYGCYTCHTIPGVPGADATVGPPLVGIANRLYIAGVLPNNPENLVAWIRNPPAFAPETAMPYLGVTESEARDIATYLYSIR